VSAPRFKLSRVLCVFAKHCTFHVSESVWYRRYHLASTGIAGSIHDCSRSQWPRGLKRRSAAAWLLGSRLRIPLGAWTFVSCVYMLCCVGRGLCDGLITRPEESCRVSLYVWSQKPRKGPCVPVGNLQENEWIHDCRDWISMHSLAPIM
jgi:hypothetical protein